MRHAARAHTVTHPAQRDAFETPHPQRQRATRFDVARPAGVSTAVVSYVLNGSPKIISPDTAQRVFDAAQRLDYHPNSVARALKTGTTHTLGVIVPDFSNPYFAEFTDQRSRCIQTRTSADHQPVARRPARRAPPHQRTRRAQRRRDVRLLRADRCRARRAARSTRRSTPRTRPMCSSSPPNSSPSSPADVSDRPASRSERFSIRKVRGFLTFAHKRTKP